MVSEEQAKHAALQGVDACTAMLSDKMRPAIQRGDWTKVAEAAMAMILGFNSLNEAAREMAEKTGR